MSEEFANLVIHKCTVPSGIEVHPVSNYFKTEPWPREEGEPAQKTFVHFGIAWGEPLMRQDGFHVQVPNAVPGDNHYDLIIQGSYMHTALIGLRPWRAGRRDTGVPVLWAEQDGVQVFEARVTRALLERKFGSLGSGNMRLTLDHDTVKRIFVSDAPGAFRRGDRICVHIQTQGRPLQESESTAGAIIHIEVLGEDGAPVLEIPCEESTRCRILGEMGWHP